MCYYLLLASLKQVWFGKHQIKTRTLTCPGFEMLCGGRGIRTPGSRERTTVFKTAAFDHSAIPPGRKISKNLECGNEYVLVEAGFSIC